MDTSNWKQRLGRIPVLGQGLRALRGVYSLPIWREALRRDIAQVHAQSEALAGRLDELAQRCEALERTVVERVDAHEQARQRQAEVLASMERRLHAMGADLEHALGSLRQLQLHALTGAGASAQATAPAARELLAPVRLADAVSAAPARFVHYQHILEPLQAHTDAQSLHLHAAPPAVWLDSLAAQAGAGLAVVTALAGAEEAAAPEAECLLDAALQALAPAGIYIVQLPNPENLAVAAQLLAAAPPVRAWAPARLEHLARLAGYADVTVLRFGAEGWTDDIGVAPADEALSRLLHGPRQYAIVARRGA